MCLNIHFRKSEQHLAESNFQHALTYYVQFFLKLSDVLLSGQRFWFNCYLSEIPKLSWENYYLILEHYVLK